MKADKQHIAIAKAVYGEEYTVQLVKNPGPENYRWGTYRGVSTPKYTDDLNAMHEAEKTLPRNLQLTSGGQLCDAVGESQYAGDPFIVLNATAAQRAEAFLRTIGKWEESWTAEDEKAKARHRCNFEGEEAPLEEAKEAEQ